MASTVNVGLLTYWEGRTVSFEAFDHYLPLGFVVPKVSEEPFSLRIVLADPLKAALHEHLDVSGIECPAQ